MTTLFSVGHSRHSAERFTMLLSAHAIERLVDVRSRPASRWTPHFTKTALSQLLAKHGIEYCFLGRELGGRPEATEFYREDGTVDYVRRSAAPDFKAGIERLVVLARERRSVILCAEEDPAHCHRRLLVAPALCPLGIAVVHIRGDGRLEPDLPDTRG